MIEVIVLRIGVPLHQLIPQPEVALIQVYEEPSSRPRNGFGAHLLIATRFRAPQGESELDQFFHALRRARQINRLVVAADTSRLAEGLYVARYAAAQVGRSQPCPRATSTEKAGPTPGFVTRILSFGSAVRESPS